MSIRGRAFVGPHVVKRWIERVHTGVTYEQARDEVIEALDVATLRKTDADGTQHWRCGLGCRWGRIRFRLAPGAGPSLAVVTVLPEHDLASRATS
jgi:hypothetical protein